MAQWYSPPAQARKQTVEVARGFESSRGAFFEMGNWWASEKSTSRYRNRWKPIQNCVIDYSFWVIDEHPKNRHLGIAIDEKLSKIVSSITHFESLLSTRKIDVSVSQSMKTYPKLCHRLLILSNSWASEKSTSRYRNGWKPVQNIGDWIVRCTRNHKKSLQNEWF